jgi:hypothetical protein
MDMPGAGLTPLCLSPPVLRKCDAASGASGPPSPSNHINLQVLPRLAASAACHLLGKTANAISRVDASGGKVFIGGEYWKVVRETPVESGQTIEVIGIEGLTLKVKPKNQ